MAGTVGTTTFVRNSRPPPHRRLQLFCSHDAHRHGIYYVCSKRTSPYQHPCRHDPPCTKKAEGDTYKRNTTNPPWITQLDCSFPITYGYDEQKDSRNMTTDATFCQLLATSANAYIPFCFVSFRVTIFIRSSPVFLGICSSYRVVSGFLEYGRVSFRWRMCLLHA